MAKKKQMDIESTFTQLEVTISTLEENQGSLNDSLEAFEKGISLVKLAQKTLEEASQQVSMLMQEEEEPKPVPLTNENIE